MEQSILAERGEENICIKCETSGSHGGEYEVLESSEM
jgi:hypothetical protein